MSLALVQNYSSEEEDEGVTLLSDDDDDLGSGDEREQRTRPPSDNVHNVLARVSESAPPMAPSSFLPSPEALFSEVTGPPEFLKTFATEPLYTRAGDAWQPSSETHLIAANLSDPVTDSGPVIVLETTAKTLRKHGQADSENGTDDVVRSAKSVVRESTTAGPRIYTATEVKNATAEAEKRNRSKIKDKEKNKRMKGQSSHATWKSETEMHLRQQFD